jgi:GGDEF domain-containing protein
MIRLIPNLARLGLHLAIGDVDGLKQYVLLKRSDPRLFGHLAGNECLSIIGGVTRRWAQQVLVGWPFALCGTFGGDEVIIAAAGESRGYFRDAVNRLSEQIAREAPRPCSFAFGSVEGVVAPGLAEDTFRELASRVDRALFDHKDRRSCGESLRCRAAADAGAVTLPAAV